MKKRELPNLVRPLTIQVPHLRAGHHEGKNRSQPVSDEASDINGAVIEVSGGMTM